MNCMPVALFNDRAKAEPVRQNLAATGINATINDHPRLTNLWFVGSHTAGVRIEVPAKQFERAEQLLLEWDTVEGALRQAVRCPECRSLRVDYPQYAKNSLLTNLAMGALAQLGLIEKDYYCEDCHFAWPKQGIQPRRNRPNLAPFYFIDGVEQNTSAPAGGGHSAPEQERKAA